MPAAEEEDEEHPIINDQTRILKARVSAVSRVTPHMAEVTLSGPDIRAIPDLGPDQFIYLFVPRDGQAAPKVDYDFTWDAWRMQSEETRPVGRYYTVRRLRREAGEFDMHMFLHGDGPLTSWAAQAAAGDRVAMWGPRAAFKLPAGDASIFLAADESGTPALAAILEALPLTARGTAILESGSAEDQMELRPPPGIEVRRVTRGERPFGAALLDAVHAAQRPEGDVYAWAAAENATTIAIRKHLRAAWNLKGSSVCAIGYWNAEA